MIKSSLCYVFKKTLITLYFNIFSIFHIKTPGRYIENSQGFIFLYNINSGGIE